PLRRPHPRQLRPRPVSERRPPTRYRRTELSRPARSPATAGGRRDLSQFVCRIASRELGFTLAAYTGITLAIDTSSQSRLPKPNAAPIRSWPMLWAVAGADGEYHLHRLFGLTRAKTRSQLALLWDGKRQRCAARTA